MVSILYAYFVGKILYQIILIQKIYIFLRITFNYLARTSSFRELTVAGSFQPPMGTPSS